MGETAVVVVVRGRAETDAVYELMDAASPGVVVQVPRVAARGWWVLDADTPSSAFHVPLARLRDVTALMISGGMADLAMLVAFEPGAEPIVVSIGGPEGLDLLPDRVQDDERFASWVTRWSPHKVSAKAQAALWDDIDGSNGHEVVDAVLKRLGFSYKGRDPRGMLEGCEVIDSDNDVFIGETWVKWREVRWVIGSGEDAEGRWFGMWDLDKPGPTIQRWPRTPAGKRAANEAQYQLIAPAILERTVLTGIRRWTPLTTGWWASAPAAFYHFNEERRLSLVMAQERPRTRQMSLPGELRFGLASLEASRFGFDAEYRRTHIGYDLTSPAEADRIAWALVSHGVTAQWGQDPSPWIDIPEDVPRDYLATAEWVRRAGQSANETT